jgi:hypothetical protein
MGPNLLEGIGANLSDIKSMITIFFFIIFNQMKQDQTNLQSDSNSKTFNKLGRILSPHGLKLLHYSDEQKARNKEYIRKLALKVKESF